MELRGAIASHVGNVRETNQDRAHFGGFVAVVADGMGGHQGGEVASAIAVDEVIARFDAPQIESLVSSVEQANRRILDRAAATPHLHGMEIRTLAADELWLSPAYQRASLCLGFTWRKHPEDVLGLLPDIEAALADFAPRPHFGKLFTMTNLASRFPRLGDFLTLRDQYDPTRKFWNGASSAPPCARSGTASCTTPASLGSWTFLSIGAGRNHRVNRPKARRGIISRGPTSR